MAQDWTEIRWVSGSVLDGTQHDAIARTHLADIRSRVEELNRMAAELERVISECGGEVRSCCTILGALRRPDEHDRIAVS